MWRVLFEGVLILAAVGTAVLTVVNIVRVVRQNRGKPLREWFEAEPTAPCPHCRTSIPASATVCAHCRRPVTRSGPPVSTE